jgi:hypothetical protein
MKNPFLRPSYHTNGHLFHGYFHYYLNSTLFKLCLQSQEMNSLSLGSSPSMSRQKKNDFPENQLQLHSDVKYYYCNFEGTSLLLCFSFGSIE